MYKTYMYVDVLISSSAAHDTFFFLSLKIALKQTYKYEYGQQQNDIF